MEGLDYCLGLFLLIKAKVYSQDGIGIMLLGYLESSYKDKRVGAGYFSDKSATKRRG